MTGASALLLVAWAAVACGEDNADRAAWLRNTLVEDNRLLMERSPALTAGKMRKMALTPYNWFRGTMGQYLRDITRPESPFHAASRFATVASAGVQLVGDPHLENVGTYRCRDGRITVEFNDFDSAAYGPFYLDVWRLSLSIEVAMSMLVADAGALGKDGLLTTLTDPARGREPVRAMAQGYFLEMRTIVSGGAAVRVEGEVGYGAIVDTLVEKAQEDGSVFEELDDYTRETPDGRREMFFGALDPPDAPGVFGDEVIGIPTRQQRLVESMVRDWATTLNDPTYAPPAARVVKGVSRRLGGGVSSYPLPRYYVLLEGPTASIDDDWLLEMREAPPKPPFPEAPGRAFPRFGSNGERVAVSQRTSHIRPDCDPLLGWAVDGEGLRRRRPPGGPRRGREVDARRLHPVHLRDRAPPGSGPRALAHAGRRTRRGGGGGGAR
jgi:hypothetical protein